MRSTFAASSHVMYVSCMPIRLTQVSPKHLQGYLNDFVFRFNRRFWPMVAFHSVLKIAARVEAATYRDLYEGEQAQPNPAKPGTSAPVLTG